MDSLTTKLDADLRRHMEPLGSDASVPVEIVPLQNRWRGLLGQLRSGTAAGIAYNVISLTSISATLPKWLVERIARRRDVVSIRLGQGES
ncbi:MAG: hypothetical protein AAF389_20505 [Gemmatimonadota bacterium]